ncbi:MazG nucleotide pyrophosphohydrolase domain-containing protein [Candidatus Altiarchaeota archaeon]
MKKGHRKQKATSVKDLMDLMDYMRSPEGCPWDREQNFSTIKKTFTSEFMEALEALEKEDFENLREELGDLLWNIIFLSQLAKEKDYFDFEDVVADMNEKIVRRHPHVFGDKKFNSADEVREEYHRIKEEEKRQKSD